MQANYSPIVLFLVLLVSSLGAWGDVLVLEGEESLSGRLTRVREGSLTFRTRLEGQLMVPMEHVTGLSTDENYVVTFSDDVVRYGRFATQAGEAVLLPLDNSGAVPVDLKAVREATVLPRSSGGTDEAEAWDLRLEGGGQARTGGGVAPVTGLRAGRGGFEGELLLEGSGFEDFPAWMRGEVLWQARPSGWGPYFSAGVARDTDNALDLRLGASLGVGRVLRSWGNGEEGMLEGMLGVHVGHAAWSEEAGGMFRGPEDGDRTSLDLHLGLRYGRKLFGEAELEGEVGLYPALSDPGLVRAVAESSLSVPLRERLRLRLFVLIDFENEPLVGEAEPLRTGVGASVQLGF